MHYMEGNNFEQKLGNYDDEEMRIKAVNRAEESHKEKIDDEGRLGVPDALSSILSDIMRGRIEPPADLVGGRKIFKVEISAQPEGEYEIELKRLQSLPRRELRKLLGDVEKKSRELQGSLSMGNLMNGYAIDPVTLESLQSTNHNTTSFELSYIIACKLNYSDNLQFVDSNTIKKRITDGFVYLEVPGFKTPIVRLYLGLEEQGSMISKSDLLKIVSSIKKDRRLLPISSDFKVL